MPAAMLQGTYGRRPWRISKSHKRDLSKAFRRPRFVLLHEKMISSAGNAESPTKCLLVELFDGPERTVRVEIGIARHPGREVDCQRRSILLLIESRCHSTRRKDKAHKGWLQGK